MTIKFLIIDYKYFCFFILVFLSSCDMDNKSFFDRVLSDDNINRNPRAFHTENSDIETKNFIEEFKKYISKDFTRYHFDILLEDQLTIGNDSIYFPVYKYDVNPENDYYGIWLLNLKTLKFESKYKLDSNTLFFSNDVDRRHSKIIVPPDTLIYINNDFLRVVNFKKNELIYEDLSYDSKIEHFGVFYSREELILYNYPYIYTIYENNINIRNIINSKQDSILINKSFIIKNFICNNDSIIFFGYNKLLGTNQTCIFDIKNNSLYFKDLNINFYNDKIEINNLLKLNKSILVLTNLGLYEYNLYNNLVENIFNLKNNFGGLKLSNNILSTVSVEDEQQYIIKYDLKFRKFISKKNVPRGCSLVAENVYIYEGGTGLYIVVK